MGYRVSLGSATLNMELDSKSSLPYSRQSYLIILARLFGIQAWRAKTRAGIPGTPLILQANLIVKLVLKLSL